jgi:hypothetical protein
VFVCVINIWIDRLHMLPCVMCAHVVCSKPSLKSALLCSALLYYGYAAGKSGYPAREMNYLLELAAQCCRALRNLSVNRKCSCVACIYKIVWCDVVWCGVVWCGGVWCGVVGCVEVGGGGGG